MRDVIERVGEPEAIGVGVPSQIDFATGTVETSVNIPLTGVPLREELGRRFGVPVFVDNDANCAALAEAHLVGGPSRDAHARHGCGRRRRDRRPHLPRRARPRRRARPHHDQPRRPALPRATAPTAAASRPTAPGQALERDATELATDKPDSPLADRLGPDGKVSGREVVAAAEDGDPDALLLIENFARMLGIGIASYVNVFEPERLAIGGGLSRARTCSSTARSRRPGPGRCPRSGSA